VNPAITLCAVIMGEVSLTSVPIYVGSQIAGSLTGYALLMAVTPDKHLDVAYGHCVTAPHDEISLFQACVVEFMATFIMALAICASWDPRNYTKGDSVSLRIGLIVFLLNITAVIKQTYFVVFSFLQLALLGCLHRCQHEPRQELWAHRVEPKVGHSLGKCCSYPSTITN
jgi:glycerol uptake facilitator-like aquaporin